MMSKFKFVPRIPFNFPTHFGVYSTVLFINPYQDVMETLGT